MKKLVMLMCLLVGVVLVQGCSPIDSRLIVQLNNATDWKDVPRTSTIMAWCSLGGAERSKVIWQFVETCNRAWQSLYVKAHPELSEEMSKHILLGEIVVGMSRNEFRASRGHPTKTNHSGSSYGSRTQFVYGKYARSYYYFENDKYTGSYN